jgi:hypothetical protein
LAVVPFVVAFVPVCSAKAMEGAAEKVNTDAKAMVAANFFNMVSPFA